MPQNWKEPDILHFLFRYSDRLRNINTYAEHKSIEDQCGSVWWGKFGAGVSKKIVEKAKHQIDSGQNTYVYFASEKSLLYVGQLIDILGGGNKAKLRPPDSEKVPMYYRGEVCSVWFKVMKTRDISNDEKKKIVLYYGPSVLPDLRGMRSLIYIRHGNPIEREPTLKKLKKKSKRDISDNGEGGRVEDYELDWDGDYDLDEGQFIS